jgi:diadenosine tetraphosphate (Ap4A) HIT family hydrolase
VTDDCPICAKHVGHGPLAGFDIAASELLVVSHLPTQDGVGFPGYVFVETRRHTPTLDELTADEVRAVGEWVWRAARALRAEVAPEYVFSMVTGLSVAHFHQHVFVRHRGLPDSVPWMRGHLGPDALTVPEAEIRDLCGRLARYF